MSAPHIGVLALQGDVREHVAALAAVGAQPSTIRRPEELEAVDAVVIPGGESTTMARLAVAFDVLEPLQKRVAEGMPAYGSCAGMIMLAETIVDGIPGQARVGGLDMVVRRNAFGRQVDSFEAPVEFEGVAGGPVHAVFIRAPWVESVGESVEVLARVPDHDLHRVGPVTGTDPSAAAGRIVAVRQGSLLATSFHPELTGDMRVHELFVAMVQKRSGAR